MDSLTFSACDQGVIDALINRKNVITVPAYLLRWIPYASVHQVILRIALEQLFYLNQLQESDGKVKSDLSRYCQDHAVQTRYVDIERWCAMSERTIIRHLDESGLFFKSNQGCAVVDDHYQQKANRYDLPALRLTPGDATDLLAFLTRRRNEGAGLEDVLDELDQLAISDIATQKPYRLAQKEDPFTLKDTPTLREILTQVFGPLPKDQLGRIEKLQFDLINPLDAYLTIPWYWFRELLPVVGHHELAAYLMCLPLTYRDRTHFTLTGGVKTIAKWVGKSTLALAFPRSHQKNSRKSAAALKLAKQRTQLALLFQPQENVKGRKNTYRIHLRRNPLLPHHQAALYTLYATPEHTLNALAAMLKAFEDGEAPQKISPLPAYTFLKSVCEYLVGQKDLAFDNLNLEKCLAFDNLNPEKVLAFVRHNGQKDLAFDKLSFEKLLASGSPNPEKGLAFDRLLNMLNGFKIPQLIRYMPSFPNAKPTPVGREAKENHLQVKLLALLDQPVPEKHAEDVAAWMLDGFMTEDIHDPPGYAHFKAIQKRRPGPARLKPMLPLEGSLVLAVLKNQSSFDLAYYANDPGQQAVYAALRDTPWPKLVRLRQALAAVLDMTSTEEGEAQQAKDVAVQAPRSKGVAFWPEAQNALAALISFAEYQTWFQGNLTLYYHNGSQHEYALRCSNEIVARMAVQYRRQIEAAIRQFDPGMGTLLIGTG